MALAHEVIVMVEPQEGNHWCDISALRGQACDWLTERCAGEFDLYCYGEQGAGTRGLVRVLFELPSDALMFRLSW